MYATRVRKGMKMPGNMGNKRRTVQSLLVYKINVAHNLVFLVHVPEVACIKT